MLEPGTVFAEQYRIQALIGEGGFAFIYRASAASGEVALKLLRDVPDDERATREERFRREAEVLAKLQSPHTVRLLDSGVFDQTPYLVFELLAGEDVADLLAAGPVDERTVDVVLRHILSALAEAHERGLIHRDITTRNIRLIHLPTGPVARLMDFGVAQVDDPNRTRLTQTGAVVGTPRYMAPEQLVGTAVTPASDLYSLAVVAYEMLLGSDAPGLDDPTRKLEIPLDAMVSPQLAVLLNRMLEPRATDRFQSATEVLAVLDPAAVPPTEEAHEAPTNTRGIAGILLLVAIAAICLALAARIVGRHMEIPEPPPSTLPRAVDEPVAERVPSPAVTEEPPPIDLATADTGEVDMHPAGTDPCQGPLPFRGWGELSTLSEFVQLRFATYAPLSLEDRVAAPAIILLTDYREARRSETGDDTPKSLNSGRAFIAQSGLQTIADKEGILLLVAHGQQADVPLHLDVAALDQLRSNFCVDSRRIFVVGMSLAGSRAMRLRCTESIAGVATIRHRGFDRCEPARAVPHIHFAFQGDPLIPLAGGVTCDKKRQLALPDYEQLWMQQLGCQDEMRSRHYAQPATCRGACDEAPFVSCVVPGHTHSISPYVPSTCPKTPERDVSYPFGPALWKFFEGL